jgi:hypothetical protein
MRFHNKLLFLMQITLMKMKFIEVAAEWTVRFLQRRTGFVAAGVF